MDASSRHHPNAEEWERRPLSREAQTLKPRERAELLESIDRQLAEIRQRNPSIFGSNTQPASVGMSPVRTSIGSAAAAQPRI
jgi:hypothetical protein